MRRRHGTVGGFMSAAAPIRGYRRCPCGQLFPLFQALGRPPRYCQWHHDRTARRRLLASKTAD